MAWLKSFFESDENTRSAWGYTFQLTVDHLTQDQMSPMKHSYDTLGDEAFTVLDQMFPTKQSALPRNTDRETSTQNTVENPTKPKRDLYNLLQDHAHDDKTLYKLWQEINTVPSWVCWEQTARGQDCFYRYGGPILTGLAFQSLLGGMGAARVVETLSRTGGFSTKVARHRLFETTQHLLQCKCPIANFPQSRIDSQA